MEFSHTSFSVFEIPSFEILSFVIPSNTFLVLYFSVSCVNLPDSCLVVVITDSLDCLMTGLCIDVVKDSFSIFYLVGLTISPSASPSACLRTPHCFWALAALLKEFCLPLFFKEKPAMGFPGSSNPAFTASWKQLFSFVCDLLI